MLIEATFTKYAGGFMGSPDSLSAWRKINSATSAVRTT